MHSSKNDDWAKGLGRETKALGSTWFDAGFHSKTTQLANTLVNRRRRVIFLGANVLFFAVIWIVLPHHVRNGPLFRTTAISRSKHHDDLIANGTLGFEKIFTIGLSDRFDKRDAIELAADVTNLKLTWMDGVTPDHMHKKAIPPTYKLPGVLPGVIGCWRSHMNVIQKIVKEKISSALILEDDADWDLRIVSQMQQFAGTVKELLNRDLGSKQEKRGSPTGSPYGEGWDILWIGHCGGFQGKLGWAPAAVIKDDESVPPSFDIDDMLFGVMPNIIWNQTGPDWQCTAHEGRDPAGKNCTSPRLGPKDRVVQERAKPVCTVSYAVSYQGARKMLARIGGISLQDVFAPLDQGMGDICSTNTDLPGEMTRCFTPSPPYVRGFKPRGPMSADSDIRKTGTNGEMREVGWSKGIVWSARLNANSIISNVKFEPESQYIKDGPKGQEQWRYRNANEYRSYRPDVVVQKWVWL